MATYRPGIDQSQHAKSVSHIINVIIVIIVALLSVYIADTLMLLPLLSQCYYQSTVTVTTADVTLVAIVTAMTVVCTAV